MSDDTHTAAAGLSLRQPRHVSTGTAARQKEGERQKMAKELATFLKHGGKIEKLGTTPVRKAGFTNSHLQQILTSRAKGRATQGKRASNNQDEEE